MIRREDEASRVLTPAARAGIAWLTLAVALHLFAVWRYRIDSDEPQHLHVTWEWAHGAVGYRDFFDNHMPLFHVAFAPLFAEMHENTEILLIGRLLMLPLFAAILVLTASLARHFSTAPLLCAAVTALMAPLTLKTVEFRNDSLWLTLLLAAMLMGLRARSPTGTFIAAILVGLAFLTSLKTVVFASAMAIAVLVVWRRTRFVNDGTAIRSVLAAMLGFLTPIAIAAVSFASADSLDDLIYCAFEFNRQFPVEPMRRLAGAALLIPLLYVVERWSRQWKMPPARLVLTLFCLFFGIILLCLWPQITTRDFLPLFPIVSILVIAEAEPRWHPKVLSVGCAALLLFVVIQGGLWRPAESKPKQLLTDVLRFTGRGDRIMDLKGETVFRARASRYTLELVGIALVSRGIIPDTVAEDLVANRCYVVTEDDSFYPPRARKFLREHYVPVQSLRIAGDDVSDGWATIVIPGEYALVTSAGVGPRYTFAAGRHAVQATPDGYVLWSPAVSRAGGGIAESLFNSHKPRHEDDMASSP